MKRYTFDYGKALFSSSLILLLITFTAPAVSGRDKISWSKTIQLQEYMKRYVFPEELISYEVEFPGTFPEEKLRLTEEGKTLEYQLDDIQRNAQGNLVKADISFRTSLEKGQKRNFLLEYDKIYSAGFQDRVILQNEDEKNHTAIIYSDDQQVLVPYGDWKPEAPFSNVPAPVLKISHVSGEWTGPGKLYGDLKVERIHARPINDGNLSMAYEVKYWLEGDKIYRVVLTSRYNEKYVTIDEYLENIKPEDLLSFRFSYTSGIDPDARMAISQSKYTYDPDERWSWCGHYDKQLNPDGTLPYQLGQWNPHSAETTHATLFWNDTPEVENAIIFSIYRLKDWKSHLRYVWQSGSAAENLYFYDKSGEKYMQAGLAGEERHWAISIFHENKENPITIESQDGSKRFYWEANRDFEGLEQNKRRQKGGGPEIRLLQKLTDFSLDWVKDLTMVWDEDLDASFNNIFHGEAEKMSYEEYINGAGIAGEHNFRLVEQYWPSYLGGAQATGRGQPDWLPDYAISRKDWTPEQRQEVRAILIHWISSLMLHDYAHAHFTMISGHPNFIMETLYAGIYCSMFPNHPDAPLWKDIYLDVWDEYLKVYLRHPDPGYYTLGGRHTECITTYSRASLRGAIDNITAFKEYDGTDLTKNPRFRDWIRWHMYALVTAAGWKEDDRHTYTPPQGAHAREVPSPNHSEWHDLFFRIAEEMQDSDPELAENLLWALTRGKQGKKPDLESALFTDYGAVLRYDFGGPHEAYLNIQQINNWSGLWNGYRLWGSMNYRWGGRGNGILYYAANDKIWSWNGVEENGDKFDINELPLFNVNGSGLNYHKTDGILYNFDEVQFYRANGDNPGYFSRDVMMVRDDYIAIYDDVSEGTEGKFQWINPYWEMPAIHAVAEGPGDNLHIVEPAQESSYQVKKNADYTVLRKDNTAEYLFMSDRYTVVEEKNLFFQGRSGYAKENLLAIFEGNRIKLGDFGMELTGQGYGASAVMTEKGNIHGRIAGNGSGEIILSLPEDISLEGKKVYVNGEEIHFTVRGNEISFPCMSDVNQGYYQVYDIVEAGEKPSPAPKHPVLSLENK